MQAAWLQWPRRLPHAREKAAGVHGRPFSKRQVGHSDLAYRLTVMALARDSHPIPPTRPFARYANYLVCACQYGDIIRDSATYAPRVRKNGGERYALANDRETCTRKKRGDIANSRTIPLSSTFGKLLPRNKIRARLLINTLDSRVFPTCFRALRNPTPVL